MIGYIPGAGDDIPQSLRADRLHRENVGCRRNHRGESQTFRCCRARHSRLQHAGANRRTGKPELLAYVKAGGVVVAQYNTTADLKTKEIGPFPLEISRDRVTDENAEVRILAPDHPLMNTPNKITAEDFKGLGAGARSLFPEQVGSALDADSVVQRSGRKAARWRIAGREIGQRLFHLHRLFVVSAVAGGSAGSVPDLRQHGFIARSEMSEQDRPPFFGTWRKALTCSRIALFAIEVALLYAFTLRFS